MRNSLVTMNVSADLELLRQKITPNPLSPQQVEQLFTQSQCLESQGVVFENKVDLEEICYTGRTWQISWHDKTPN